MEAGAGLRHLLREILKEKLVWRLKLVWGVFLHKPLRKARVEADAGLNHFSLTNPLRRGRWEAGAGLRHFPLQILSEELVWRLELV